MQKEGTVKFFNETKGFGFIIPSNGEPDVFVHSTGLVDTIRENDRVTFEVERGKTEIDRILVRLKHNSTCLILKHLLAFHFHRSQRNLRRADMAAEPLDVEDIQCIDVAQQ